MQDECVLEMKCPKGFSLSFWMKFESGDYILTSGGYAERRIGFLAIIYFIQILVETVE